MIKDRFLISGLRRGDIRIFENLFHRYYPGLCSYAESLLRKENVAEEMVQDIFYNLWKNRKEIEIRVSLKSYLYKSVYNRSMMHLRKTRHEVRLEESWAENLADNDSGPLEKIGEKEITLKIADTLGKLPERTRVIFTLSRIEGLKYTDIAEKLSISVKTVEANMGKALSALRKSLNEYSSS